MSARASVRTAGLLSASCASRGQSRWPPGVSSSRMGQSWGASCGNMDWLPSPWGRRLPTRNVGESSRRARSQSSNVFFSSCQSVAAGSSGLAAAGRSPSIPSTTKEWPFTARSATRRLASIPSLRNASRSGRPSLPICRARSIAKRWPSSGPEVTSMRRPSRMTLRTACDFPAPMRPKSQPPRFCSRRFPSHESARAGTSRDSNLNISGPRPKNNRRRAGGNRPHASNSGLDGRWSPPRRCYPDAT